MNSNSPTILAQVIGNITLFSIVCNGIYCQEVLEFLASSNMARLISLKDMIIKSDICTVDLMQGPTLETYKSDYLQPDYLKA